MPFSSQHALLQQAPISRQKSISGAHKLRRVASKIFHKLKFSKSKEHINLEELDSAEIQVARFVNFNRSTEAPQIIDLKAMRQTIPSQPLRLQTCLPKAPLSQADLSSPVLRLQRSFEKLRSVTETGTPIYRNPQQAFVFEATSDRSAAAVLDDVVDDEGYEVLDDEVFDLDWSLLDLPENVYGRLANESRHSLL